MNSLNLKQLAENIRTQDNRITQNPIFCVYEKEYVVLNHEYSSRFDTRYVWVSDEGCTFTVDDKEFSALDNLTGRDEITVDGIKYEKICQSIIPCFITAFFSENGANEYLRVNGHNLNEPYIHIHSLNRNAEMIGLRNHLINDFEGMLDE